MIVFDLQLNQLTGTIPSELGQFSLLNYLALASNQLSGTIPNTLTQLINVRQVYLFNNNLTGQMPSGFCSSPFPDWRADGTFGNTLWADCIAEVQCDCCELCVDPSGTAFCWNGFGFYDFACF